MTKPIWTNAQIIAQLDSGAHWSGSTITYGFPTSASWLPASYGEKAGFSALTAAQQDAATFAIGLWDDLIAPGFVLAANPATATVKLSNTTTNIYYAQTYFPSGSAAAGSVWLNPAYGDGSGTNNLVHPIVGEWGFKTYVHELGHALGLDHPGPYNGGAPTYANNALYFQDSMQYTVMSYFTASNTGADWIASDGRQYYAQTPMLHDILAIQAIYGADPTTRSSDTTYGFAAVGVSWLYDFTQNPHPVLCIYDAGGLDTLNFSGWNYTCTINLTPGSFSSGDMMTSNVSIALNTWIENGIGGSGNDFIYGNDRPNSLSGLGGDDFISAGSGDDALYGLGGNDMLDGGLGADRMLGGTGHDTYVVDNVGDVVDETGGDGIELVQTTISFSLADSVHAVGALENLTLLGSAAINGTGNGLSNWLAGNAGDNILIGLGGNDMLDGGAGIDTASYAGSSAGVTVSLMTGLGSGGDAAGDTLVRIENLTGSAQADTLEGNAGANMLVGGAGTDTVSYERATAGVTVNLAATWAQDTIGAGLDTLSGFENLTGSGFNDTLTGNAGDNILTGLGGNDTLDGGLGADRMLGGTGHDIYVVDNVGDVVDETGGDGIELVLTTISFSLADSVHAVGALENLTLLGSAAINGTGNGLSNWLAGNAGDNILIGLGGNDMLDGGAGIDTASYAGSSAGVTVSLMTGLGSGGDAAGDTLVRIENLTGSAQADTLEGNAGDNILIGLGGNDMLDGGAGIDTASYAGSSAGVTVSLMTGLGSGGDAAGDTLVRIENLTGSAQADTLEGNAGANMLVGGAGTDTVSYERATAGVTVNLAATWAQDTIGAGLDTLSGFENLTGSGFNDTLTGNAGDNILTGLGGNDTLDGGLGADRMLGGTGHDIYVVDNVGDVVDETGGDGIELVLTTISFSLADSVHAVGALENLTLLGSAAINGTGNGLSNWLAGNAGDNILIGLGGNDMLDGGAGIDTASYAGSSAGVTVSLMTGLGSGGDAAGDTLVRIENLTGSAQADTLEGNAGANMLVGGAGIDTVSYERATAGVTVNLAATWAQDTIGAGLDTLSGFENLTGSGFNDTLTGNAGDNILTGLGGNDTLDGGLGADRMLGGTGHDTYVVDNVGDVVDETGGDGIELVLTTISFSLADSVHAVGALENLTLLGSAAINGTGNGLSNWLAGNAGDNILIGLGGNDMLDGGAGIDTASYAGSSAGVTVSLMTGLGSGGDAAGDTLVRIENLTGSAQADTLEGNAGANMLVGGAGTDTVSYERATAGVTVNLAATWAQDTIGAGLDTLSGFENLTGSGFNDTLTGNAGDNILTGLGGNDTLDGGLGNDILIGGAGLDRLTGGIGSDTFRFHLASDSAPGAVDVITDFSTTEQDKIDLSQIDGITATIENDAFIFIGSENFTGVSGQLRFAGDEVLGDLNGDGIADLQIHLDHVASLSASNFIL